MKLQLSQVFEYRRDLDTAQRYYEGEYMSNILYYDWVLSERRRLQEAYLNALRELSSFYSSQGQLDQAILLLDKSIQLDGLNEDYYCDAMRCYAIKGDVATLVRQYQQLEITLQDELNVQPSTMTKELYNKLLKKLRI